MIMLYNYDNNNINGYNTIYGFNVGKVLLGISCGISDNLFLICREGMILYCTLLYRFASNDQVIIM